ncbi:acetyl-coenzyme A transporter 1 [Eurytemora carolleeae]|uniref:acetyl-coenzyme A transporter 1 n=1 Tax=Eurytemora carolleeae TaxID=1294199 RepID=UPI000C78DDB4|nr:acetyl-coenzyme A transporter 1 [Eurytemora carolleeae]XP_023327775.1 acetyl-coenzyme A transporter 1 [Eurytemora carolleeae]XP_023327776.1 acetyl-coenzyme A transporter 1 [Eurytemora carolleeae]|eukprot:XP_023327774.1 acetyl-coenzyme A transporter 1-like [Eurytemora affinis]
MFVSIMAFFAQVSDPAVGGTYMTLLNTLTNLGGNWPTTLALWCVEGLTFSSCLGGEKADEGCGTKDEQEACLVGGGSCSNYLDGYYAETGICILLGTIWLVFWGSKTITRLQDAPLDTWRVVKQKQKSED